MTGIDPESTRSLIRHELRHQSTGQEQMDASEFQTAVIDASNQTASKTARHDQRKSPDPAPSAPKIKKASRQQKQAAKVLMQSQAEAA